MWKMRTRELIEAFLASRRDMGCTRKTLTWYDERLGHLAAEFPNLPMQAAALRAFIGRITVEPETRHATYRVLRTFYGWLRQGKKIRTNPMDVVQVRTPRPKVMPTLDPEEAWKIREVARATYYPERDFALVSFILDTGAREGEVAGLLFRDIGAFTAKVKGKAGEREVPISPETRRLLLALDDGMREYVFEGERGQLTPSGVYQAWRRLLEAAGIEGPKWGPHRARHAFARNWLLSGGDLQSLAQVLGIRLETAARYAKLFLSPDVIRKHRRHSLLRAATGQGALFVTDVLDEAEEIISRGGKGEE